MTKRLLTLLIVAGAIALPAQTPTAPGQTPHAWPGLLSPKQPGYPSDLGSATALPINPLDYGAKCDGVTDDTQALQNALTAAAQTRFASLGIGSEIVQLPSGVCIISTT